MHIPITASLLALALPSLVVTDDPTTKDISDLYLTAGKLAPCAQKCTNNILSGQPIPACKKGDVKCLCTRPNFVYAMRDCGKQSCPGTPMARTYLNAWAKTVSSKLAHLGGESVANVSVGV